MRRVMVRDRRSTGITDLNASCLSSCWVSCLSWEVHVHDTLLVHGVSLRTHLRPRGLQNSFEDSFQSRFWSLLTCLLVRRRAIGRYALFADVGASIVRCTSRRHISKTVQGRPVLIRKLAVRFSSRYPWGGATTHFSGSLNDWSGRHPSLGDSDLLSSASAQQTICFSWHGGQASFFIAVVIFCVL